MAVSERMFQYWGRLPTPGIQAYANDECTFLHEAWHRGACKLTEGTGTLIDNEDKLSLILSVQCLFIVEQTHVPQPSTLHLTGCWLFGKPIPGLRPSIEPCKLRRVQG